MKSDYRKRKKGGAPRWIHTVWSRPAKTLWMSCGVCGASRNRSADLTAAEANRLRAEFEAEHAKCGEAGSQ